MNIMQAHTVESTTETVRSGFLDPRLHRWLPSTRWRPKTDIIEMDGCFGERCTYPD